MRVLIAGGGTGGHIYPAISIAKALLEVKPSSVVEFVGTPSGLETRLIPQAGFQIHTIAVGKLNVGWFERVRTLLLLPIAIIRAFILVARFSPDVVVGVGGYASGPLVLAAALMGRRTVIWEPNAYPGLANRWLSHFVNRCLVVFEESAQFLKNQHVTLVHMPVRKEIEAVNKLKNLSPGRPFRVLVFGGSQGARAINNALSEAVVKRQDWLQNIEIIHQTGRLDYERIRKIYQANPNSQVQVLEYLHDMPERYTWADLVISRSGTGTISELAACGKAALLIPFPHAADDHQTKNALALERIGGARVLNQTELTSERLIEEILHFKNHPEQMQVFEQRIRAFHKPRAAYEIANIVVQESQL